MLMMESHSEIANGASFDWRMIGKHEGRGAKVRAYYIGFGEHGGTSGRSFLGIEEHVTLFCIVTMEGRAQTAGFLAFAMASTSIGAKDNSLAVLIANQGVSLFKFEEQMRSANDDLCT